MIQLLYPHRAQIRAFLKKFEVFFNDFSKGILRESYGGYGMDAHALHVYIFRFFQRKNVVPSLKSDRIKLRIHRGSVFDLSQVLPRIEDPPFRKGANYTYVRKVF